MLLAKRVAGISLFVMSLALLSGCGGVYDDPQHSYAVEAASVEAMDAARAAQLAQAEALASSAPSTAAAASILYSRPSSVAPVMQAPEAPAPQAPSSAVATVDRAAFSSIERGKDQQVAAVEGKLRFPVLGLNAHDKNKDHVKFIWDDSWNWYVQSIDQSKSDKSPYRLIQVRGSAHVLPKEFHGEAPADARIATLLNPRVSFEGESSDHPDAIRGDFAVGNIAYSVSLMCKPVEQAACRDERSVEEAIRRLRMLGG